MNIMKIPIIILNYNSSIDCRKCVKFLKRQEGVELEIVIVDNCSPREGEQESIKSLCEEQGCTFLAASKNRGYNAGNNIGLHYATEKGYKYALIANPDMEFPQTNYVARMVNVMEEKPEVAACGSNILNVSGERQNPWAFSSMWEEFPIIVHIAKLLGKGRTPLPPKNCYCDILHGCCLMINLPNISQYGFFDENIFLFCEEAILGKQIKIHGKKMYYLHDATAIHAHVESAKGSVIKRYELFWRSRRYYLKNYSGYNKLSIVFITIFQNIYVYGKILYFKLRRYYE